MEAVVFDLDGVLVDSDHVWHEVREGLARERGGRWSNQSEADMSGMSSTEWSRYLHDVVGISDPPEESTERWCGGCVSATRRCRSSTGQPTR